MPLPNGNSRGGRDSKLDSLIGSQHVRELVCKKRERSSPCAAAPQGSPAAAAHRPPCSTGGPACTATGCLQMPAAKVRLQAAERLLCRRPDQAVARWLPAAAPGRPGRGVTSQRVRLRLPVVARCSAVQCPAITDRCRLTSALNYLASTNSCSTT